MVGFMRVEENLITLLHDLADTSSEAISPYFRANAAVENKAVAAFDPVTAADRAAEAAIRAVLNERVPDHGIHGEEYGVERPDARFQWVIDPIDGTRAFIQGLPVWGTLIGLMDDGAVVAGIMNQPFTGERYWSDGSRSHYRGPDGATMPIKTRHVRLEDAQMATTDPYLFAAAGKEAQFERLRQKVRQCRYGTDCYAYCLIAAGHIDVVLETGLQLYDIAALIPIIEHAGGRVTTWTGEPVSDGGDILACGDARLHGEIVQLLAAQ